MWIWFVIIVFIIVYLFILSDSNPYRLIFLIGKRGSGKTSLIAKLSLKYQRKGYKVYSNIEIPGNYVFDPSNIGIDTFEPNSIVFLDEIGLLYDNRKFKDFKDYTVQWFKYSRQYKIKMYMFSQAFDVDKKIRDLTDEMYLLTRLGKVTVIRKVHKKLGISTDQDGNGQLVDTYRFGSIFDTKFIYLPRYYGMFKSFDPPKLDIIEATYQDYNEVSRIYADTKKWAIYRLHTLFAGIKMYCVRLYRRVLSKFTDKK